MYVYKIIVVFLFVHFGLGNGYGFRYPYPGIYGMIQADILKVSLSISVSITKPGSISSLEDYEVAEPGGVALFSK